MNLEQHADAAQRVAAGLTYTVSGGLVVGDVLQFLNNNAGAVGAVMAMATFAMNWYYQHQRNNRDGDD
ncbi:HP1 family phage holin [Marinobacterium stanieri]|uniref:HP1 family phage holin n=1 Tax=Marinobacterium stanieri TaxID=49186 RepID=UPI000255A5EC|nr:HP1 family phage holin [Marinobacterium stanieri]